jgi:aldose sugar dehydrogenase
VSIIFGYAIYTQKTKSNPNNLDDKVQGHIKDPALKLESVLGGLEFPTSMAFLGPNDMLVMENQKGTVQRIVNGTLLPKPLLLVNVTDNVDRCMCGIAIVNGTDLKKYSKYVFVYFTEKNKGQKPADRLYKYEFINNQLVKPQLLMEIPATANHPERHAGGAILITANNTLYLTTGDDDGLHKTYAQNYKHGLPVDGSGGILRMTTDGKPIRNNGILGDSYPLNLYYAYGIRNSYGLDIDPVTDKLWDTENGPDYGDEINMVEPGFNSGSNKVLGFSSNNNNFSLNQLADFEGKGKYNEPEFEWHDSVGPTALRFLTTDILGKSYRNDVFVGSITQGNIYHFDLNKNRSALILEGQLKDKRADTDKDEELEKVIFAKIDGGVSDLKISPYDGYLYGVAYGQGKIFRIVPIDT